MGQIYFLRRSFTMELFSSIEMKDHEQITFFQDKLTGLKTIIGVHSTVLGPALGGCRMWTYENEAEALKDVLRLSRGMTYKAALAGLNLGGGKAVILANSQTEKTSELLKSFGRAVEALSGRYITAEDVGMSVEDIDTIRSQTTYAVGGSNEGGSGDPSVMTAYGVFQGMKACVKHLNLKNDLSELTVAVQGVGHVGYHLCSYLHAAGCNILVADIYPENTKRVQKEFGVKVLDAKEIHRVHCDIFAPCALGAGLNSTTIPELNCKIVAGSANNQLATEADGQRLMGRNIAYAPDYVINAGGLINVAAELDGYDQGKVMKKVAQIEETVAKVLNLGQKKNIPPQEAADELVESILAQKRGRYLEFPHPQKMKNLK